MNIANISCIYILGDNHAYNAAYDSQNNEWIYLDSTWMSGNTYRNGEKHDGSITSRYFDMTVLFLSRIGNHKLFGNNWYKYFNILDNSVLYSLITPFDAESWRDVSNWFWSVSSYTGTPSSVILTNEFYQVPVTTISGYAFYDCTSLQGITIPDSVISVGFGAFMYCTSLQSVIILDGATTIGDYTFIACTSLQTITIPISLKNIGNRAFLFCESLEFIYYYGSPSQWSEIQIDETDNGNYYLTNATLYCCYYGSIPADKIGLYKIDNTWYYVKDGKVNYDYTGLVKHTNGVWYYVQGGQIKWSKTGLVKHTDGHLYYVKNGQINWNYTGNATYDGKTYKVVKGKV